MPPLGGLCALASRIEECILSAVLDPLRGPARVTTVGSGGRSADEELLRPDGALPGPGRGPAPQSRVSLTPLLGQSGEDSRKGGERAQAPPLSTGAKFTPHARSTGRGLWRADPGPAPALTLFGALQAVGRPRSTPHSSRASASMGGNGSGLPSSFVVAAGPCAAPRRPSPCEASVLTHAAPAPPPLPRSRPAPWSRSGRTLRSTSSR